MISNLNNYDLNKIFVPWNHAGEIAKDHPPTIFDNEILLFRILASQTRLIREAWLHSWWLFYRNGMDTFNFTAINAQLTFREKSFWEITAAFTWLQINRPLSLAEETEVIIFSQSKRGWKLEEKQLSLQLAGYHEGCARFGIRRPYPENWSSTFFLFVGLRYAKITDR